VFNKTSEQKKDQGNTIWAAQVRYPHRRAKIVQDVNFFHFLGFTLNKNMDREIQGRLIIKKIKTATENYGTRAL